MTSVDARTVDRFLRQAAASQETTAPIDLQRGPAGLTVSVGAGAGNGTLLLIGYDRLHQTQVGRCEKGVRTLVEANIVRSMLSPREMCAMLYKLEVEKFFSIRDQQILDLTIDKKIPDIDGRYNPGFQGRGYPRA
jgi:hypothetical protein